MNTVRPCLYSHYYEVWSGCHCVYIQILSVSLPFSDAVWEREVLLLPFPDQRAAVDLATDTLLHNLPPMEFKARVYSLHAHSSQVTQAGCGSVSFILPSTPHFSSDHLTML